MGATAVDEGIADEEDVRAAHEPRLSVIVPTFQRREILLATLRSLGDQDTAEPFEVIVVDDGSTDGTAAAVRGVDWPFTLVLVRQDNSGPAAARNRGASRACAPVLLFIDDDMEADRGLIRVHLDAHDGGAEAVTGAMPLHPKSPRTLQSEGVARWAEQLATRCARPGYELTANDIFGGQLSIRRDLFHRLGGYDERFTAGGVFGNEDVDLSHRLVSGGHRVRFRRDAVTYQRYVVTAAEHLRRWEEAGEADVALARLHTDLGPELRAATLTKRPTSPAVRATLAAPRLIGTVIGPWRRLGTYLVDRGNRDRFTALLWSRLDRFAYWSGVARAGGPLLGSSVRVLCWHAVRDLSDDPVLAPYGVPPAVLREQLRTLRRAGWVTIDPEELVRFLDVGGPLPRRAVMLTFDDCTEDLLTHGQPILSEAGVSAIGFVVTRCVGGWNRWDEPLGVTRLPLADWDRLRAGHEAGLQLGGHSRTHAKLPRSDDASLTAETAGCRQDLIDQGLPAPTLFAYPHGEQDRRVRAAARAAGYRCAFTVDPGVVRRSTDAFRLPRIEVMPDDQGVRLRLRLWTAGRPARLWWAATNPRAARTRIFRRLMRALR